MNKDGLCIQLVGNTDGEFGQLFGMLMKINRHDNLLDVLHMLLPHKFSVIATTLPKLPERPSASEGRAGVLP